MAEIKCPMCGKPNPAELDVCQYCEARLKPVTDELSRSQPPIRPGEEPKDMDTGQLESVLPKWLRDIRQQSRESADEETGQPPAKEEAEQQGEKADLLAGLRSQSGGDEEIPDWLAGLRSEGSQVGFEETSTDEDDMDALRSMLGEGVPDSRESEASALPGWVSDLGAEETEQAGTDDLSAFPVEGAINEPAQTEAEHFASGSDFRWDADFETDSALQAESTEGERSFDTELPAWLQDTDKPQIEEPESGLPAWLGSEEPPRKEGGSTSLSDEGELPAWLQDKDDAPDHETDTGRPAWLDTEKPAAPSEDRDTTPVSEVDLSGWLASLGAEESGEAVPPQDKEQSSAKSTTDWLASLDEENAEAAPPQSTESAIKSTTDWLASLDEETTEMASQQETAQPAAEGEMPDWLTSLGKESPEEISQQETEEPAAIGDLPDWLATLGEESGEALPQEEEVFSPSDEFVEPANETSATSTFVDDEGKPISKEDVEAIFSMDMPDWLSDAGGVSDVESTPPAAEAQEDELRPADLPSWVQAMRPVESVISETEGAPPEEQPIEERGPLAGLRGVLPAVPGVRPFNKPKAYSIKLQASEDQQSNAAMLEKMLAEEVNPEPVTTQKVVLTQRLLRLAITILFLLIVAGVFFSGTRISPISASVPPETKAVIDYIQITLPANAPVLLVFDYEAARAGELEAAAAPLLDQMLTLKAPRLSLISSTPTGSGLSERFVKILQTDREYARNDNFVNLGYLSGGAAGVQAFAKDPASIKQLTTTGEDAWTTPALQDVRELSNFAAIILLTDNVETARIWIEQTESDRGETQLLVVSSAQSGPMIMPYERSGQIDGMVTGLDNSAPIEQANSGRPGMVRRYWDAYGFGLLTAVVMISIGSLWSLVAGWQTLRKEQGKG